MIHWFSVLQNLLSQSWKSNANQQETKHELKFKSTKKVRCSFSFTFWTNNIDETSSRNDQSVKQLRNALFFFFFYKIDFTFFLLKPERSEWIQCCFSHLDRAANNELHLANILALDPLQESAHQNTCSILSNSFLDFLFFFSPFLFLPQDEKCLCWVSSWAPCWCRLSAGKWVVCRDSCTALRATVRFPSFSQWWSRKTLLSTKTQTCDVPFRCSECCRSNPQLDSQLP